MNKVQQMLEDLEKELRKDKQYSAADKLLPIIEEAKKDGWIPCSKGLPKIEGSYLVTKETTSGIRWVSIAMMLSSGEFQGSPRVVAYKEIPEPYKGE